MNTKHTKGPWFAPSAGVWTADGMMMVASLGGPECVASRREYAQRNLGDKAGVSNKAEMDAMTADLALIAAAPMLLDLLKATTFVLLDEWSERYGVALTSGRWVDVRKGAIAAAIAKAEGKG